MTVLARILAVIGLGVVAYVIFFAKPREVIIETPAEPQLEKQQVQPQPPKRPQPHPRPQPANNATFEPERNQPSDSPIFRSLQAQPKPAQTQKVRKAPSVYAWEEPYNAAMMETDRSKRQERIDAAQTAINRRIEEIKLNAGDGSPEERNAIQNAQLGLNLLRETNNSQSRR